MKAPLFKIYDGQRDPQPAYVSIDLSETDPIVAVDADYDHEIGGATTFDVYRRRVIQLNVEPAVDGDALNELLESDGFLDLVQVVLDDSSIEWDGQNHVGETGSDADEALEKLQALLDDLPTVEVWTAEDWLSNVVRWVDGVFYDDEGQPITAETAPALIEQYAPTEGDGVVVFGLADYINDLARRNAPLL